MSEAIANFSEEDGAGDGNAEGVAICCIVERTPDTVAARPGSAWDLTVAVSGVIVRPWPAPTRNKPGTRVHSEPAAPISLTAAS